MKTHAIAAVLAAVSVSAFAQPGSLSSGSPSPATAHAAPSRTVLRTPVTTEPVEGVVLAKIDQNNTPPDRGGETGRQRTGSRM